MHSRLGMISVIHMTPATTTASPKAPVDSIIGFDYAFRVLALGMFGSIRTTK